MNYFKKLTTAFLAAAMLIGCSSAPSQSSTQSSASEVAETQTEVTITDHAGREVTVKTNPKSVVITDIFPLASMLTVYLDGADTIKAMHPSSYSAANNGVLVDLYPEVADVSTDILSGDAYNIETIVALNPDIVYYNAANSAEQELLENAGLTAVAFSATKFGFDAIETYNQWMDLLEQIYPEQGADRAEIITKYAENTYDDIQEKVADVEDKQKVLFLYQYDETTMITSSKKFFGEWWCNAVGAVNVATDVEAETSNAVITMEQVYEWDPDVIIITNFTPTTPEDIYKNAIGDDDWSNVTAVKDQRVYKMPLGVYRTYTPGIDTPVTLKWLAQAVYPEIFSDYEIASVVKEYYNELFGVSLTDDQIQEMYTPNSAASTLQ